MKLNMRSALLASAAFSMLTIAPAHAATTEQDQIQTLQQQIQALQKEINKLAAAQAQAPVAPAAPAAAPAVPAVASSSSTGALPSTLYQSSQTKITAGGWIEADTIYRNKNENADLISNFNTSIPFNNSANAHQSEFRETARATRLSLLAEGTPSDTTKLVGYLEGDFLGSTNATTTETNSYSPRIRQGYVGYERSDWGFNVYAGQTWSLATLYKNGLSPRSEALPSTIDIALLPGYTYVRDPGVRVVKTLDDDKVSIGLSFETPQANLSGVTAPNSTVTSTTNTSSATLPNTAIGGSTSTDVAPDIIGKVAYDPGFGHYEVFGLGRFFHDNINVTHNNTVFAGGGGLGTVIPVVPKYVDFQGNALVGEGIGRYGPALLPDFSYANNGDIRPLGEYIASVGLTGHPNPSTVPYLFAGAEKVYRRSNSESGYGELSLDNEGCYTALTSSSCSANTSSVWQITAGVWQDIYKGNYGNMKVGVQDSFTRRNAFSDSEGYAPHATENMLLTSFRYSPF